LADPARSAVEWCGVVSIASSWFIPPEEGRLEECTCTTEY
jgi:hypothetical protein